VDQLYRVRMLHGQDESYRSRRLHLVFMLIG